MIKILIETIPHHEQRYPTCGDWFYDKEPDLLTIRVSNLGNWRYETLVALHELVEAVLCSSGNVTQEMVDKFDFDFEKKRVTGNTDEPGDDINAPYAGPHCVATGIERVLAAYMGVSWSKYEEAIDAGTR